MVNVGEAKDTNVNQRLLVVLGLGKEGLEASDGSASLGHNSGQHLDVDTRALEHVVIRDEFDEPRLDLQARTASGVRLRQCKMNGVGGEGGSDNMHNHTSLMMP